MSDFESLDFLGDEDSNNSGKKSKKSEELEKILKLEEEAKKVLTPKIWNRSSISTSTIMNTIKR